MLNGEAIVELPCGWWHNGARQREVVLREVNGGDECWLNARVRPASTARIVSGLLSRCIRRLGMEEGVTPERVSLLTVGDRESLLLHLRRITFGEVMAAALTCPFCAAQMDVDLSALNFLLDAYSDARPEHETILDIGGCVHRIAFRLPVGADQEAAASAPTSDAGARLILARCLLAMDPELEVALWPGEAIDEIGARMSALDPQAELRLTLPCADCGATIETMFDAASYFLHELALRGRWLHREVHLLARNYHWSEADIFSLSRTRRQTYLSLIAWEREAMP